LATGIKLLQLHQRYLHFSDKTRINNPNIHFILGIDLRDKEQTAEKVNCSLPHQIMFAIAVKIIALHYQRTFLYTVKMRMR